MTDMLGALLLPSNVCYLLALAGLALCIFASTRRAALVALATAAALLAVFSSGKTATALLSPLEYAYPRVPDGPLQPVRDIVVLTAYVADDREMSLSDRPSDSSLYRVAEAALLWHRCADCTILVTGRPPATTGMAELLAALGVPSSHLRRDDESGTTRESAVNVRRRLGDRPFYLVTSAGHMPRSMAVFAAAGLRPLAAPTDHKLPRTVSQAAWGLSPFHQRCSDLAVHERIGLWWYRLRDWS